MPNERWLRDDVSALKHNWSEEEEEEEGRDVIEMLVVGKYDVVWIFGIALWVGEIDWYFVCFALEYFRS